MVESQFTSKFNHELLIVALFSVDYVRNRKVRLSRPHRTNLLTLAAHLFGVNNMALELLRAPLVITLTISVKLGKEVATGR